MKNIFVSLTILFFSLIPISSYSNYLLIENVSLVNDNSSSKTVEVEFDISWENSWLDDINWDAAWVFIKYKNSSGEWHHASINTNVISNGSGMGNEIDVTSDHVGAFIKRIYSGAGDFDVDDIKLQWDYGTDGLNSLSGVEVRVYGVEMVFIPDGEFNIRSEIYELNKSSFQVTALTKFYAPGNNSPVINSRLSPALKYIDHQRSDTINLRIKGDAGIDTNLDGVVNNTSYPNGYFSFYVMKYEVTEQQMADFYNSISQQQYSNLHSVSVSGTNISELNGQYISSTPNKVTTIDYFLYPGITFNNNGNDLLLSYADWIGLRPFTLLELNKLALGPEFPLDPSSSSYSGGYAWNTNTAPQVPSSTLIGLLENGEEQINGEYNISENGSLTRAGIFADNVNGSVTEANRRRFSGASFYGVMDISGNAYEPAVDFESLSFSNENGDGEIGVNGEANVTGWSSSIIDHFDLRQQSYISLAGTFARGLRFARSYTNNNNCPKPSNVQKGNYDNTNNTIELSWDAGGNETQWTIESGPKGFTPGSGTQVIANTNTNYSFSVNPNIPITEVYIKANCSQNSSSNWIEPVEIYPGGCDQFTAIITGLNANTDYVDLYVNNTLVQAGIYYDTVVFSAQNSDTIKIDLSNAPNYSFTSNINVYNSSNEKVIENAQNISYVQNGYLIGLACVDCKPVRSDITRSLSSLSWTPHGTETQWEIEYGPTGFSLGSGTINTSSNSSFTIPNQTSDLDVYISALCSGNIKSLPRKYFLSNPPSTPNGVSCTSGSPTFVYQDDLETTTGWSGIGTGNGNWKINSGGTASQNTGPSGAHSGSNYFYFESSTGGNDVATIVSPAIDLTNASGQAELSFWFHFYGQEVGTFEVGIGTSVGGTFNLLGTIDNSYQGSHSDSYLQTGFDISSYMGQTIYLEFKFSRNLSATVSYYSDFAIDLIKIETCN